VDFTYTAAELEFRLRRDVVKCRVVDALGAGLIAEHAERGGKLRLGDRRLERVKLGIGEVAQIAERCDAVARKHVVHIGKIAAAVLGRIVLRDVIAQIVERQPERDIRHGEDDNIRGGQRFAPIRTTDAAVAQSLNAHWIRFNVVNFPAAVL
jgi:hypothetical protein